MKIEDEIKQKQFANPYQKLAVNILFTASWLQTQGARILKPYGITIQQYNVLRILRGQLPNPASVGLLQERMLDKSSNASRLVDKLLEKKLLERKICPNDRRQVDIRITESGLALLSELEVKMNVWDDQLKILSEKEVAELSDMLDKLRG
jgi:DNA-binding MarR family transcriptional regulator